MRPALEVGTGLVGAPACGDVMKLQIKVSEDGVIEDARFQDIRLWLGHCILITRHRMAERADAG